MKYAGALYLLFFALCSVLIILELGPSLTGLVVEDADDCEQICTCVGADGTPLGEMIAVEPAPVGTNYLGLAITVLVLIAGTVMYLGLSRG